LKTYVRPRDSGMRFNVTPLIDICFNLIVFFGIAGLCLQKETAESVSLPAARQLDDPQSQATGRLVVTIDGDRRLLAAGRMLGRGEIERLILEGKAEHADGFEVRIRADKSVPYEDVKPLILACARHGLTRLKFAVEPK
jgi:biopolymer transport protein ExbD